MTLLDRLGAGNRAAPPQLTTTTSSPASWLFDALGLGGIQTYAGKSVTPDSALHLIPVYSAVTTIAGDVGSLPLIVYRRLDKGRERARDHRTWTLLHDQPNDLQAADAFWETVMAHVLTWGEGFAAKQRGKSGLVEQLWPLRPDIVGVETKRVGWKQVVRYDIAGAKFGADDILHFRGLSLDGVRGVSPIAMARHMIGNGLALEEFQGRFWTNNARPSGVLKTTKELNDKAAKRLKARWEAAHGGLANAARVAVLEEGMEWQQLGVPLADAQFMEQQKMTRSDTALLYRLPPYKLAADNGSTMRYENTESASLDYVKFCLRYWLRRLEGSLKADPDIFLQGSRFYAEFLADALLRGDSAQRAAYYAQALDPVKGWMRREEVRDTENLNPETPAQLKKLAAKAAPPEPTTKPQGGGTTDPTDNAG